MVTHPALEAAQRPRPGQAVHYIHMREDAAAPGGGRLIAPVGFLQQDQVALVSEAEQGGLFPAARAVWGLINHRMFQPAMRNPAEPAWAPRRATTRVSDCPAHSSPQAAMGGGAL